MSTEGTESDKKSLRVLSRIHPDWDALACDCVAFAKARGGCIQIGIEDGEESPAPGQRVLAWRLCRELRELRAEGLIQSRGEVRWRRYILTKTKANKPTAVNRTGQ